VLQDGQLPPAIIDLCIFDISSRKFAIMTVNSCEVITTIAINNGMFKLLWAVLTIEVHQSGTLTTDRTTDLRSSVISNTVSLQPTHEMLARCPL